MPSRASPRAGAACTCWSKSRLTSPSSAPMRSSRRPTPLACGSACSSRTTCSPISCGFTTPCRSGRLGRPLLASARVKWFRPPEYYGQSRWRGTWALDGGGALMNQGIHTADLLLWLLGPVRRVSARAVTALHPIEVEDTVVALLEFESGAVGTLEATTAAYPGYRRRLELTGTEGTVIVEHDRLVAADLRQPGRRPDRRGARGPERQRVLARGVRCARAPAAVRGFLRRDSPGTGASVQRALRAPECRSRPRDLRGRTHGRLGYAVAG